MPLLSMPPMSSFQSNKARKSNKQTNKHKTQKRKSAPPAGRKAKRQRKNRGQGATLSLYPQGPGSRAGRSGRIGLSGGGNFATTRRSQVIEEDEFIAEVNGSVGFVATQFSANPGQATSFPWGNRIAALYEKYEWEMLEFYYKREVSEFATNGQAGKVMLSFDYDATDSAPTTKQQVEDTVPHADGMPCTEEIRLRIDCAQMRVGPAKFVRPGAQPAATDLKTYDVGNLFVCTQGCTNATNIGELHVRYRVRLLDPVLEAATVQGGVIHFSGIAPTTANNFVGATQAAGGSPNLTGITLGTNTVVFPAGIPGNYLLALTVAGATSASALTVSAVGTGTTLNLLTLSGVRDATFATVSLAGTTTAAAMCNLTVTIPTGGATITYTPATVVGASGAMDLFIISLPASVLTLAGGVKAFPQFATVQTELQEMRAAIRELRSMRLSCDSDFEDDHKGSSCSSRSAPPLSGSTLDMIGELIARKSSATK